MSEPYRTLSDEQISEHRLNMIYELRTRAEKAEADLDRAHTRQTDAESKAAAHKSDLDRAVEIARDAISLCFSPHQAARLTRELDKLADPERERCPASPTSLRHPIGECPWCDQAYADEHREKNR